MLAHANPRHLGRLLGTLSSPSAVCFVHIDRKSPAGAFAHIRGENVHFTRRRVAVHWGDFSIVEATILLMRAALAHTPRLRRFVLISGADYPLRSPDYIERFFDRHDDAEFMNLVPMPSVQEGKPITRLTVYKRRPGMAKLNGLVRNALVRLGAIPRERDYRAHLRDLAPYGGSAWWALSREACEYVVGFFDRERRVVRFFKHTHAPDETFFHTVLGNSDFRHRVRRDVTYADWTAGGSSPAPISEQHLERFRASRNLHGGAGEGVEALFARKFSDESTEIAERLRRLIDGHEAHVPE